MSGVFYNDMYSLELDKAKWFPLELRYQTYTFHKSAISTNLFQNGAAFLGNSC